MAWVRSQFRLCPAIHGETVPVTSQLGLSAWWPGYQSSGRSAPAVGGHGGSHQRIAQLAQLGSRGAFIERRRNVFCRASHLINAIGQVSGLVSGQHHRVGRQRRTFRSGDRGPLLVGPLPTRLPAVLAPPAHPAVGDVAATPAAWLRADATCHGADFSRGSTGIPVSWNVESHGPGKILGTLPTALALIKALAAEKTLRGVGTNG
jgi:hypothetical protein